MRPFILFCCLLIRSLAAADHPNALVEVAFLSNPEDEKKILNPKFQKLVARKIYLGIMDWLKQMKP